MIDFNEKRGNILFKIVLLAFCLLFIQSKTYSKEYTSNVTEPFIEYYCVESEWFATANGIQTESVFLQIQNALSSVLGKSLEKHEIVFILEMDKNQESKLHLTAKPALKEKQKAEIEKIISEEISVKPSIGKINIMGFIGKEKIKSLEGFEPALHNPFLIQKLDYAGLSTLKKKETLKLWIQQEVLPVIQNFCSNVDPKFVGIRALGNDLKDSTFLLKKDYYQAKNLWRAHMEFSKKDPMISLLSAMRYVALDQWEMAQKQLEYFSFFMDPSSLSMRITEELNWRILYLIKPINERVLEGIKLHDSFEYKKALLLYDTLLQELPEYGLLKWERFLSEASLKQWHPSLSLSKSEELLNALYVDNPLCSFLLEIPTDSLIYKTSRPNMLRRSTLSTLFRSKEMIKNDFKSLSETLVDLEIYPMAAQINWLMAMYFTTEDQNLETQIHLQDFIYSLQGLGLSNWAKDFFKDYEILLKYAEERQKERTSKG